MPIIPQMIYIDVMQSYSKFRRHFCRNRPADSKINMKMQKIPEEPKWFPSQKEKSKVGGLTQLLPRLPLTQWFSLQDAIAP